MKCHHPRNQIVQVSLMQRTWNRGFGLHNRRRPSAAAAAFSTGCPPLRPHSPTPRHRRPPPLRRASFPPRRPAPRRPRPPPLPLPRSASSPNVEARCPRPRSDEERKRATNWKSIGKLVATSWKLSRLPYCLFPAWSQAKGRCHSMLSPQRQRD